MFKKLGIGKKQLNARNVVCGRTTANTTLNSDDSTVLLLKDHQQTRMPALPLPLNWKGCQQEEMKTSKLEM